MQLFRLLIYPGLLFLAAYTMFCVSLERKLYARMQNRRGPDWRQPLADMFKLIGKEWFVPEKASERIFALMPVLGLAAVCTAFIYLPITGPASAYPFNGDLLVVLYLLMLPTIFVFLGGWYSSSLFATFGGVRALTQMVAYELPFLISVLSPAMLANSWSLQGIAEFYAQHPLLAVANLPGFAVAVFASMGKLMRQPFDGPLAGAEQGGGAFSEYGGRLYAYLHLTLDCETVVILSLLAAVFIPFYTVSPVWGFAAYVGKTLLILLVMTLFRALSVRLHIEQVFSLCWRYLVPVALIQFIADLLLKGVIS